MPLTIRIESLRRAIYAHEQGIENLIQKGEENVTQVAALQLMRERGTSSIETNGQDGESQTITYDSALLRTLCIPVDQQLFIAEMLAALQVKATEAQISCLTATIARGQETVLLGEVQRKTRLFALAQPHLQTLQERIKGRQLRLEGTERTILADPDEMAIIAYQRTARQLEESKNRFMAIAKTNARSAALAETRARASDLPDFAVDVAFQSGLIQGTKESLNFYSSRDEDGFITNLAVKLAEQIKFV